MEKFLGQSIESYIPLMIKYGANFLIACLILFIGFRLAKFATKALKKGMTARHSDANLIGFIATLVSTLIKIMAIVTAVTQLGIAMTSFAALLGAAALSIGMAFSGTLSNFAGGVIILLFKPFKSGDWISSMGKDGEVQTVTIFNTIIKTAKNELVIFPNGMVINNPITNITSLGMRRLEWVVSLTYGDDVQEARNLFVSILENDPRVLKDKPIFVGLGELGDSSIDLTVRCWVNNSDYVALQFAITEKIYEEAPKKGLSFPFPTMDVNVVSEQNQNA